MTHYNLLGVDEGDSFEKIDNRFDDIKQEYQDCSEFLFLEQNENVQKFEEYCEAYFVLSNPVRRMKYDKSLGIWKQEFETLEKIIITFSFENFSKMMFGFWFDSIKPIFESTDIQNRIRPLGEYYKSFLFDLCTTKPQAVINEISPQINSSLIDLVLLNLTLGRGTPKHDSQVLLHNQFVRTESIRLFINKLYDLWKYNNENEEKIGIFNGYELFFYIKLMEITRYCQKVMEFHNHDYKLVENSSTEIPLKYDSDLQNEIISIKFCQICHGLTKTQKVIFEQNIGLILMRRYKKVEGNLCADCIRKIYWEFSSNTLFFGWWGLISFFLTPFILINNTISYISTRELRKLIR